MKNSKNKNIMKIIRFVIGISIILFLLFKIGISEILSTLAETKLGIFLIAYVFLLLSHFLDSLNVYMLIDTLKNKIKYSDFFAYYTNSRIASLFLPGRIGDFSLTFFTKRHKISIGESGAVLLLDKIITLIIYSLLAAVGFYILLDMNIIVYLLLFGIVGIVALIILLNNKVRQFIRKKILGKRAVIFKGFSKFFFDIVKKHKIRLLLNILNTFLRITVLSISYYFIFLSLGVELALFSIILVESIISIAIMIPITINGMGVKESIGIFLYGILLVSSEITAARYVLSIILYYSFAFILYLITKNKLNIAIKHNKK